MPYNQIIKSAVAGGLSGLIATVPMTVAMRAMFPALPRKHQYPLPPRQIVTRLAHAASVYHKLDDDDRRQVARVAHFGFGTAAGAAYGLIGQRVLPGVGGGMLFGTGVWAASYLGWLPATGILPPATRMPARRNALMIASHLVWGAAVASIFPMVIGSDRATSTKPASSGGRSLAGKDCGPNSY